MPRSVLLFPLIERELRVALRKKSPARHRFNVALLFVVVTAVLAWFSGLSGRRGMQLHQFLCLAGFYAVAMAPGIAAGALARERQNQTLGLLFLSGMRANEVFLGKLASAAVISMTTLLAVTPMLAIPFLMGGVSFDLFIATICCLPNLLFFALAVTLLASALTADEGSAHLLALALIAGLCLAAPVLRAVATPLSAELLKYSPAYGGFLVFANFKSSSPVVFWQNFTVTTGLTLACLAGASYALKRLWREHEERDRSAKAETRWHRWFHGDRAFRRALHWPWLELNAFVWLAARDRQPGRLATVSLAGITILFLVCCALWPRHWLNPGHLLLVAVVMNLVIMHLMRFTAAKTLADGRRDGSYELLLTSRLQPGEIVLGQIQALRLQFVPAGRVLVVLEATLMLAGLTTRPLTTPALDYYLVVWGGVLAFTRYVVWHPRHVMLAMWVGLNSARPGYAVWKSAGIDVATGVCLLLLGPGLYRGLTRFPTGTVGQTLFILFVLLVYLLVTSRRRIDPDEMEVKLGRHFRAIVREPVPDPDDKRFKIWNHREKFPLRWPLTHTELYQQTATHTRQLRDRQEQTGEPVRLTPPFGKRVR